MSLKFHGWKRCLGALCIAHLVAGCNGASTYNAPGWFTDRSNLGHWASVPEEVSFPMSPRWTASLGGGIRSSVIGGAGLVLVGADDNVFYALDPHDGSQQWTYAAGDKISASATAVALSKTDAGHVWFGDDDGDLYALDSAGAEVWTLAGSGNSFNSATNYATGRIFQVYTDQVSSTLRAVNATTGDVAWESASFNVTTATPMHTSGNVVLGINQQGVVFRAYDPATGDVEWEIAGENGPDVGPLSSGVEDSDVEVGEALRLFVSIRRGKVRAIRAIDGTTLWEMDLPEANQHVNGFAISRDLEPNVVVVSQRNHVTALNADNGDVLWDVPHADNPQDGSTRRTPRPAIYGLSVFHVEGGTRLVARALSDGSEQWSADLDASTVASPTVGGNTVYIGTSAGTLYAFSPNE